MHTDDDRSAFRDLATSLGHLVLQVGELEIALFELVKQLYRLELRGRNPVGAKDPGSIKSLMAAEEEDWRRFEQKRARDASSTLAKEGVRLGNSVDGISESFLEMKVSDDHLTWLNFGLPYPTSAPQTLEELLIRVGGVLEERNTVIHANWIVPPVSGTNAIGLRVDRDAGALAHSEVGLAHIDSLINEAAHLGGIIRSFTFGLGVTRGPAPRRR